MLLDLFVLTFHLSIESDFIDKQHVLADDFSLEAEDHDAVESVAPVCQILI